MALKILRDNLKSFFWVLWLVILAMVGLVFFEWGGFNQQAGAANQAAAWVGDEEVSFGEFQNYYRNLENYYRNIFQGQYNQDLAKQLNLPVQALNQLINNKILLMEARRVGLEATDDEVAEEIVSMPNFQRDGRFIGEAEYLDLLRSNRVRVPDFEDQVREQILLEKLDALLASTTYVPEGDLEAAYRDQVERAKVRFLQLPGNQMGEIEVESSELEAYLADHAGDFEVPEQRSIDYLLVDTNKIRQQIEITDEEMRAYYSENEEQYTRKEQVRARHILRRVTPDRPKDAARAEVDAIKARIQNGEDFAALAREMSDDESNAANGGNLPPFGRGEMVPEFEEAAFNAQPGTLVGPIETSFGFHLIEKQSQTPGGLQPFEQVEASIRARLLADEANTRAESKALELAGRVTAESTAEDLTALAEAEGMSVELLEPFGLDDTIPGIGRNRSFTQAAFDLEAGGVSEPVRIARGWAIMKLKETLDPRAPALDEIEDDVRQAVLQERRKEAALARLEEAKTAGTPLDDVAGEFGLAVEDSAEFGRQGSVGALGSHNAVIEAALSLDQGAVGGPFTTDQGAVLFEVVERKTFDPADFEENRDSTRATEEQKRVDDLKRALIEQRRRELNPRYGPDVITNFGIEVPEESSSS